jgi:serine/threonine protein kinase
LTDKAESKIFEAFDAIHSLGIVHSDIRPENILVAEDGNSAWIVDFEFTEIIAEGFHEKHPKITQETGAVKDLLTKITSPRRSYGVCRNGSETSLLETGTTVVLV